MFEQKRLRPSNILNNFNYQLLLFKKMPFARKNFIMRAKNYKLLKLMVGINPGHPPRLPGLNPLDVTRLTLMKIMGQQNQMSFLPPTSPKQELQASGNEELPSPVKLKENSDKEEENKLEDDEEKKKLVVCIEINSIKYQGILFAQPPTSVNNVNSAVST